MDVGRGGVCLPGRRRQLLPDPAVAARTGYSGGSSGPRKRGNSPGRAFAAEPPVRRQPRALARRRRCRWQHGARDAGRAVDADPAERSTPTTCLDAVGDVGGPSRTQATWIWACCVRLSRVRVGLAARNLAAPTFRAEDGGVAGWSGRRGSVSPSWRTRAGAGRQDWVVAIDARPASRTDAARRSAGHRRGRRALVQGAACWRCAAASRAARLATRGRRCPAAPACRR